MNLPAITDALAAAYAAETSADAENWSPANPTYGHCAVVSLIVQDHLGGDLVRTTVEGVSHYFNRLDDGTEVDLTREQFAAWTPTEVAPRARDYVLSYGPTAQRYQLLRTSAGL